MLVCTSLIGAVTVTAGWMLALSYVDYLVSGYRRQQLREYGTIGQPLAAARLLGMPWNWLGALVAVAIVFGLAWMCGLLGFGMFVLANLIGVVVLGVIVFSDWQQLQRRPTSGPPVPVAWLYGVQGEYAGQRIQVSAQVLSLGRSTSNAIVLHEQAVSRRHASIRYGNGRFFLQDQDSTHGTYVNGQPIDAVPLSPGDRIAIGDTEFEFRLD